MKNCTKALLKNDVEHNGSGALFLAVKLCELNN